VKAAGGWRLAAGGCGGCGGKQLVAGGWRLQVVAGR